MLFYSKKKYNSTIVFVTINKDGMMTNADVNVKN